MDRGGEEAKPATAAGAHELQAHLQLPAHLLVGEWLGLAKVVEVETQDRRLAAAQGVALLDLCGPRWAGRGRAIPKS